jgi:hypothetical protein
MQSALSVESGEVSTRWEPILMDEIIATKSDDQIPHFLKVGDLELLLFGHRIHIRIINPSRTAAIGDIDDF